MAHPEDIRGHNTYTIGAAFQKLLEEYRIKGKFNEARLIASWEAIMGKPIASRTKKIFISKKRLVVELTSAPLKNELSIAKEKVLKLLAAEFGDDVITDITFR